MIRKWVIYPIDQEIVLPGNTEVIHVGEQRGLPTVWTRNIESFSLDYVVKIFGTGQTPPQSSIHVGSVQIGMYVWHVFKRPLELNDA